MNLDVFETIYTIGNVFMAYVIYKFMGIFYKETLTDREVEIASYVLYIIVITVTYIFIKIPIVMLIANILMFFLITFNYKSSLKKRILTVFLIYVTLLCVEMIVVLISGYFNLDFITENNYGSVLGIVVIRIMSYVVVLGINHYKNIRKGDVFSKGYWICIVVIPSGTLYLLIRIFVIKDVTFEKVLISTIIVLTINFATFYLYDDLSRILLEESNRKLISQDNKHYKNQLDLMKISQENTKSMQHDLKNHLMSLYALTKDEKREELLDYLSDIMERIDNKQEIASTGNFVIDSIVNFKLQDAVKENIDLDVELSVPQKLNVASFDITVILGNSLDNAIDAVKKLEKNRYINLKMKYTKGSLVIKIDNSYNGIINEKDGVLLTTNKNKEEHGMGLGNIKSVLEKYNGTISFEYDDDNFQTTLLMYV